MQSKANTKIQNSADGLVRVTLDGDVGQNWFSDEGVNLNTLRKAIDENAQAVEVDLRTMGGDLLEAFAMYDYIRGLPIPVTVNIVGATASAGTVIAMAADKRTISENSKFLIHNVWTVTQGDSEEHQKQADALARFDRDVVNIYHKATGMNKAAIRSLMKEERWMDATEAKEKGFVHKIRTFKNQANMENEQLIKDLQAKVAELQASNETLLTGIAERDTLIADFQAKRIDAAIKTLESDGKVTEANRANVLAMLQKDFDGTMNVLNSIRIAPDVDPEKYINKGGERVEKDYDYYMKHEPAAFLKMMKEDPAGYQKIIANKQNKRRG